MNFTHTETSQIVTVTVKLPSLKRDPKTGLDTNAVVLRERRVRTYLQDHKIDIGKCIQSGNTDNMGGTLNSVWKFEKKQVKTLDTATTPVVSSNKAKRVKKSPKAKDD